MYTHGAVRDQFVANMRAAAGKADSVRVLAHAPAFCRSQIWLWLWSFSHILALLLPVVSLILNTAQERCLYIAVGSATCLCSYILGGNKKKKTAKDNTGYIQFQL